MISLFFYYFTCNFSLFFKFIGSCNTSVIIIYTNIYYFNLLTFLFPNFKVRKKNKNI